MILLVFYIVLCVLGTGHPLLLFLHFLLSSCVACSLFLILNFGINVEIDHMNIICIIYVDNANSFFHEIPFDLWLRKMFLWTITNILFIWNAVFFFVRCYKSLFSVLRLWVEEIDDNYCMTWKWLLISYTQIIQELV